ncbi:unnamed protein product [Discosporangium mesarthrocarpum]
MPCLCVCQDLTLSSVLLSLLGSDNARHLWRRLPVFAKEPGGEVASLWEVGKCLWSRDMEGAHAQLRKISWDPSISPVIEVVRQHLVDRQLALISRGYATIPLKFVAAMLGCDTAKAEHECVVRGWDIGEGGEEKSVKPQPCGADRQRVEAATPWHLLSMAEHITFLEQRSIG